MPSCEAGHKGVTDRIFSSALTGFAEVSHSFRMSAAIVALIDTSCCYLRHALRQIGAAATGAAVSYRMQCHGENRAPGGHWLDLTVPYSVR